MSLNVLITAGSRRVPLVQAFQRALRATGGGSVIVTDVNPLSPTVYVADRSYPAPLSTDPSYIDAIVAICRRERVGLVVPTIDDELATFAAAAPRFAADGIRVAVSGADTVEACNDKYATFQHLSAAGLPVADTRLPADLPADPAFPLFIKPRVGRGGVGAYPVRDAHELEFFLTYVADPVLQPYLHGPEFTIDVLSDFDGRVIASVPRERVVIRAGVVDRGRTVHDQALIDLGCATAEALGTIGPINVQCRVVDGQPTIFEINPRFSGGIPLTIAAGADFPRLLTDMARGRRVTPIVGRFQDGLWMTSYETSVFVAESSIGFSPVPVIAEVA
ncbi:MAG: ATP-grasp domain-containing protein [Acidobacteria bacterium]|nr:ATP-grasp domain-containing protein [Acidobacteriota bacterium]